jgi:hypothetical protein
VPGFSAWREKIPCTAIKAKRKVPEELNGSGNRPQTLKKDRCRIKAP